MALTVVRILRFVLLAFSLAALLSSGVYYWLFVSASVNADWLDVVTDLRGRSSRVHWVLNRGRLEVSDLAYLRSIQPLIDGAVNALDYGGTAFGRSIPPVHGVFPGQVSAIRRKWAALAPGLSGIASLPSPELADDRPHARLHPTMPEFELQVMELQRLVQVRRDTLRRRTLQMFVVLSGLVVVVLSASAVLISRRIMHPMKVLMAATRAIRRGEFGHRIPAMASDELGALGESFNEMTAVVQKSVRDLTESVENLKAEVEERRRATAQLLGSEARLAEAQRIAHAGNWEVDLETDALYWSDEVYRIFGLDPQRDTATSETFWNSVHPDDIERVRAASKHFVASGEPYAVDHRIVRPDGQVRLVRELGGVVRNESGVTRLVGTVQDITEQSQIEEQLRQAQKMEAIGFLAGGVAHDFNNLLTVILGYSHEARAHLPAGSAVQPHLQQIQNAGEQAASLTAQLLAYGRKQILQPRILDLNAELTGLQPMLRRLLREDIALTLSLKPRIGAIQVDRAQLQRIVLNLVINARDAMPDGGRVTIETADADLSEEHGGRHFPVAPGPYVMFAVSDTGIGMDAETLTHMFEPFFTTKSLGHGTGLGLASVYGIVRQSGGNIWAYSEPDHGTTLKIYFPRVQGAGSSPDSVTEHSRPPASDRVKAKQTILVVEDDLPVRGLTVLICKEAGYEVLEAENGAAALALFEQHPGVIHLVITDVIMPEMSGRTLGESIHRLRPETKILYCSGYAETAIVNHEVLQPGQAFLPKPFTPDALLEKVSSVLRSS
jgi:PAS domain S-box-containing protein